MQNNILLFIPMYNCEKQITRVLSQFNTETIKYFREIIVIDNNSIDKSRFEAIEFCKQHYKLPIKVFKNNENYGLGGSQKFAFEYAIENNFEYVIMLHGDDQGNINDIIPYLKNKEYKNFDCFLGARFMKKSNLLGYPLFRTFGNYIYNIIFSFFLGFNIFDLGSGLNMYNVEILKCRFFKKFVDNLMFNYCMIIASSYYKHKIKFFPISWRENDQVSNVKLTIQAIETLKLLLSYVINKKKFITTEHRKNIVEKYQASLIYQNNL